MQTFSLDDYRALRTSAGVRERPEMALIGVAGKDRLAYLHAMLTNDIQSLRPGRGCYSAYLTPQGRMIADMVVVELGDLTLVHLDAATRAEVFAKLEQFIFSEDVQLHDLTPALVDIAVAGPRAAQVISNAVGAAALEQETLGGLAEFEAARATFQGGSALVLSSGAMLGVPAFDVFVDRERALRLVAAVMEAGAVQVSWEAVETVRIEAGLPRFGSDMDEHTIPLEAGIEGRAISFSKGCYPGQEVITRVVHRGHGRVAKKLVGLVLQGEADSTPERFDRIVHDGKEVGTTTSAVWSPALGKPIALGYVQREHACAGSSLAIEHDGRQIPATVADLPFVR